MAWMTFVVAGFNPTPPTALDIQARSTQDMSFSNMNSTAVALAANMIGEMMPSPIVMPVTGNEGSIPTPTVAVTLRAVSTVLNTSTPFSLFGFLFNPTSTREIRPDGPTSTFTPVPTFTFRPTSTRMPSLTPSRTPSPVLPTATLVTPSPIPEPSPTPVTPTVPTSTPVTTEPPATAVTPTTEVPTEATTEVPPTSEPVTSEPVVETPEPTP